jgi:hypothetical protein
VAQLLRVQNFSVSRDGFGAGENQSFERPFGDADPGDMFAWAGATASWPNRTDPGGSRGLDDYFTRDFARNIGAEIMGRNKFGPQRGPWRDYDWQGWWGDEPPFHTPVFVMTHYERRRSPCLTPPSTSSTLIRLRSSSVPGRPRRARMFDSGAGRPRSGSSSTPTSSTPSMWRSPPKWRLGLDRASGSRPMS